MMYIKISIWSSDKIKWGDNMKHGNEQHAYVCRNSKFLICMISLLGVYSTLGFQQIHWYLVSMDSVTNGTLHVVVLAHSEVIHRTLT